MGKPPGAHSHPDVGGASCVAVVVIITLVSSGSAVAMLGIMPGNADVAVTTVFVTRIRHHIDTAMTTTTAVARPLAVAATGAELFLLKCISGGSRGSLLCLGSKHRWVGSDLPSASLLCIFLWIAIPRGCARPPLPLSPPPPPFFSASSKGQHGLPVVARGGDKAPTLAPLGGDERALETDGVTAAGRRPASTAASAAAERGATGIAAAAGWWRWARWSKTPSPAVPRQRRPPLPPPPPRTWRTRIGPRLVPRFNGRRRRQGETRWGR